MSIKVTADSIKSLLDAHFDGPTKIENLRRLSGVLQGRLGLLLLVQMRQGMI